MNTAAHYVAVVLLHKYRICIHTHTTNVRGYDLLRAIALSFPCGGPNTTPDT